jgi:hypothetical protein
LPVIWDLTVNPTSRGHRGPLAGGADLVSGNSDKKRRVTEAATKLPRKLRVTFEGWRKNGSRRQRRIKYRAAWAIGASGGAISLSTSSALLSAHSSLPKLNSAPTRTPSPRLTTQRPSVRSHAVPAAPCAGISAASTSATGRASVIA